MTCHHPTSVLCHNHIQNFAYASLTVREITKSFLWGIFKTSSQAKLNFSFEHFAKAFRYILQMLLIFFVLSLIKQTQVTSGGASPLFARTFGTVYGNRIRQEALGNRRRRQ